MTTMLSVTAFQFRDPVTGIVQTETYNATLHERRSLPPKRVIARSPENDTRVDNSG